MVRSTCRATTARSGFAGFRFPPEVITLAVRWYLRFGLSYRDVEELLAERGIEVDHVTGCPRLGHVGPTVDVLLTHAAPAGIRQPRGSFSHPSWPRGSLPTDNCSARP